MTKKRWWMALFALGVLTGAVLVGIQIQLQREAEQRVSAALAQLPPGVEARYETLDVGFLGRGIDIHDLVLSRYGEPALYVEKIEVEDLDRSHEPPHHMRLEVSGVEQKLRALPLEQAQSLERLGYATLRGGYVVDYDYDPDAHILSLGEFSGELEGVAKLRVVLELHEFDLAQAAQADSPRLPEFSIARAKAEFRDHGFAETLIERRAREEGISEERYRKRLDAEIVAHMNAWNTPFARQLGSVLRQHLHAPGTVVLRVEPERPVPVYELITAAIIDPKGLPARLGVTVEGGE